MYVLLLAAALRGQSQSGRKPYTLHLPPGQVWDNRLYPWQCVPDEADDTLGTVTWARNDERALDRRLSLFLSFALSRSLFLSLFLSFVLFLSLPAAF